MIRKFFSLKTGIALGLLISTSAIAQVNVNSSGGVPAASYTSLRLAFNAINAGTHTGTIAIGISANTTETAACVLNESGAGAASYTTVGIAPTTDGVMISGPTVAGRGLVELNGADNVIIDGDNPGTPGTNRNLTIKNTAGVTIGYTSCVRLATSTLITGCDNITIRNLNLYGSGVGRNTAATLSEKATWGIIASANASTVSTSNAPNALATPTVVSPSGQTYTALTISNNNIQTATRGISINGSALTVASSLTITDNTIGNPVIGDVDQIAGVGITVNGSTGALISGNTIRVESYFASATANRGINIGMISNTVSGIVIEKNNVERNYNNNVKTRAAIGIDVSGGPNHIIRNNFVGQCLNSQVSGTSSFNVTNGAVGIRILGGTGHMIYHNTVHLTGTLPGTVGKNIVAAFAITSLTSTGLDVRNNIFSNQVTGGNPTLYNTVSVCVFLPSAGTSSMNLTLNNNTYYQGPSSLNGIGQTGITGSAANLYLASNFNPAVITPATNFRSYTRLLSAAGTNDNASYASSNPAPLIAPTNLHVSIASPELPNVDQKAALSVGLATDIDGDSRPSVTTTIPDIGADEFSVATCVAANGGTISPASYSSCVGETVLLTSVGATNAASITYQWLISSTPGGPYTNVSGGAGANTVSYTTPVLTAGTNYYVLQTTCSFGPLVGLSNEVSITTNTNPVVTISGATSFCSGGNTILTGSVGGTYQWFVNDSLIVGATNNTISATSAGYYNMQLMNASGCADTANSAITITVNPLPTITATATPAAVCTGGSTILNAGGAATISWSGGVMNNVSFIPVSTNTYTVTGTDGNGCTSTATQTVTVNALPSITATALPSTICAGETTTFFGSGGTAYVWTGGISDNVGFVPALSSTYTVTGTDVNGCTGTASQSVTVNVLPTVTATATPAAVCAGGSTVLSGSGANSYSWTGGVSDNISFVPVTTGTYTVTGTDLNGCTNTVIQSLTVNALPTVTANASAAALCAGSTATLTGGGASTYVWDNSVTDGLPFTPAGTLTYNVTGTDVNGCTNTASATITVNALPTASFSPFVSPICDNASALTLTGGSPSGGTYSGTAVSAGLFDPTTAGGGMFLITYTYTDGNACSDTDTATITVDVCSGIAENFVLGLNIFPNPTNGSFTISADNVLISEMKVSVMDVQGRIVYAAVELLSSGTTKAINLDGAAKGIYTIKIESAAGTSFRKLIIQ